MATEDESLPAFIVGCVLGIVAALAVGLFLADMWHTGKWEEECVIRGYAERITLDNEDKEVV